MSIQLLNGKRKSNIKRSYLLLFIVFIIFSVSQTSCKKDEDDIPSVSSDIKAINTWIKETMEALYLWNENIPRNLDPSQEKDPEAFFDKMIYKTEDPWSFITPDFNSLLAELLGTPLSSGISPSFIRIANDQIIIIIEYVYKNSPADVAGLNRGDMIITINGQTLNLTNYADLFFNENLTLGLGQISGGDIVSSGESFTLQSVVIDADPLIHYEVINVDDLNNVDSIKTGYMVYSGFTSGLNDRYITSLVQMLADFKTAGIEELIVDLRYNRGGEIDMAAWLASAIAPKNTLGKDVLVKYFYNKGLADYFKSEYGDDSEFLVYKFPENNYNLDLSKVHILTGWKTASASELLIIGLSPYMEVVTTGEKTVGKYAGSWVITDTDEPPRHDWAMMPIVLKYANALGFTDFKNGLNPQHPVEEFVFDLQPFGDPGDPTLAKALQLIGGGTVSAARKAYTTISHTIIDDTEIRGKGILIVPSPPDGLRKGMKFMN